MDKCTHEVRKQYWKNIINQCLQRPEGITAKQWLDENNICEQTYYHWLKRIRQETYEPAATSANTACVKTMRSEVAFAEVLTKKYKQRLVPYEEKLADIIYRYCAAMGILTDSEAYLFPTIDKDISLTSNTVRNYFKEILTAAGIQNDRLKNHERGACLHCLRHTFVIKSFDKNKCNCIKACDSVPFFPKY